MREYVMQWVRLCESICAPDRILWCGEIFGQESASGTPENIELRVTTLTEEGGQTSEQSVPCIAELPLSINDLKGVLRDRTMYVLCYRDELNLGMPGALVTDSPGTICQYRQRYGIDWVNAVETTEVEKCIVTIELAFPAYRAAFLVETVACKDSKDTKEVPMDMLTLRGEQNLMKIDREPRFRPAFATANQYVKRVEAENAADWIK